MDTKKGSLIQNGPGWNRNTVAEYCEKWLLMQSVHIRATTLTDYTSKIQRHIIKELGQKRMADVTLDDIQLALVPVSQKSASVYKSVVILYKSIFRAAKESHVIDENPTIYLDSKGGVPQEERQALTDEHNRPVILTELKTKAAERNIPLPVCLAECLKAAKAISTSDYVVANRDGEPLSYTQFKRLW